MALGQYRLFLLISAALLLLNVVSAATASPKGEITGGRIPISNISDPHVQELGEYAVTVYNAESGTNLKFVRVISGEIQPGDGVKYWLVIEVLEGVIVKLPLDKYEAIVYEKRDLESFKPLHV